MQIHTKETMQPEEMHSCAQPPRKTEMSPQMLSENHVCSKRTKPALRVGDHSPSISYTRGCHAQVLPGSEGDSATQGWVCGQEAGPGDLHSMDPGDLHSMGPGNSPGAWENEQLLRSEHGPWLTPSCSGKHLLSLCLASLSSSPVLTFNVPC